MESLQAQLNEAKTVEERPDVMPGLPEINPVRSQPPRELEPVRAKPREVESTPKEPEPQEETFMGDLFGGWFNKITNAIDITGNVESVEDDSPPHDEPDFIPEPKEPDPVIKKPEPV